MEWKSWDTWESRSQITMATFRSGEKEPFCFFLLTQLQCSEHLHTLKSKVSFFVLFLFWRKSRWIVELYRNSSHVNFLACSEQNIWSVYNSFQNKKNLNRYDGIEKKQNLKENPSAPNYTFATKIKLKLQTHASTFSLWHLSWKRKKRFCFGRIGLFVCVINA